MSSALNKLSTKLEPSGGQNTGAKSSNVAKNAKPLRPPTNKSINTSSKVSSLNKSMEGRPSEELKKSKFQYYQKLIFTILCIDMVKTNESKSNDEKSLKGKNS